VSDPVGGVNTSWSFSYNASLAVTDPLAPEWNLGGSISGSYHEVDTDTVCPSTTTTVDSSLSEDQAALSVGPIDVGVLVLSVFPRTDGDAVITGITTMSGCHGNSTGDDPVLGGVVGFPMSVGPASGSTFSGSDPDALPNFFGMPDGSAAKFNLTWNLRLVRP